MLVTEKAGRLRIVEKGKLLPEPVAGLPKVWAEGQGGLLDVAPHPDYATNGWIYLSYSAAGADGSAMTRVMRGRLKDGALVDQQTLYDPPAELYRTGPNTSARASSSTARAICSSRSASATGGTTRRTSRARTARCTASSTTAACPRTTRSSRLRAPIPTIWSYGHRNPQGLARNPATGELYDAEHGPRGGDEINLVRPGRNYGWPIITYGMNYDGTPITNLTAREGLEQPVTYWTPSIAVCAIDFYVGDRFPRWKNDLLVSSLAAEELRRLRIDGDKLVKQEVLFKGVGRIRDVVVGPDGLVYLAFNVPDRIARLVPVP